MEDFVYDMKGIFRSFGFFDFVDILIVAYLIYQVICLLRETRALQLAKGLAMLGGIYMIASLTHMRSLSFLLKNLFQVGAVAVFVMFQPELRRSLEQVGRARFSKLQIFSSNNDIDAANARWRNIIDAIGEASSYLSKRRIGALIVLERQTPLGEIIKTGTVVDSTPSAEIFGSLFFPNSPLHDGAVVVRDGRLIAAGCYLPLSDNFTISKEMGTRHRAALGMSENSDAVIVIVSEETGVITVAEGGKLRRGFTEEQLVKELSARFIIEKNDEKSKSERLPNLFKVKR